MQIEFDIETDGLDPTRVWCIATKEVGGEARFFGPDELRQGVAYLREATALIAHNALGFDLPVLERLLGFKAHCQVYDSLVISRLWWPHIARPDRENVAKNRLAKEYVGKHSLAAWGARLGAAKGSFKSSGDQAFAAYSEEMREYCEQDVRVLDTLWSTKIVPAGIPSEAVRLEQEFAGIVGKIMKSGIPFDRFGGYELEKRLVLEEARLTGELQAMIPPKVEEMKGVQFYTDPLGNEYRTKTAAPASLRKHLTPGPLKTKVIPFNPRSKEQVLAVLDERHGWKPKEKTKTGQPQLGAAQLSKLDFPEARLLTAREILADRLEKLSTGEHPYLSAVAEDGRIHCYINHNGTETMRCTHSRPNLGQVPRVKSPWGKELRSLFLAPKGWSFLGCDAKGLEVRCLAHHLNSKVFNDVVLEGDIHALNMEALGFTDRDRTKTWFYAFMYGAGDGKLGKISGGGRAEGAAQRAQFLARIPGFRALIDRITHQARTGYLKAIDGRRIPAPEEYTALNRQLQTDGAVYMKAATCRVVQALTEQGYVWGPDYEIVHSVHDELQILVPTELAPTLSPIVAQAFRDAGEYQGFRIPMDGDAKFGPSWATTH